MEQTEPSVSRASTLHRGSSVAAVFVLACLFSAACGDRPDETARDVPEIELRRLAVIGPRAHEAEVAFGSVADLEIGENGSVFVLDGMNRMISAFDQGGTLIRTFGRRGQGPGELERPTDLLWGPDGNLWVVDLANARYTVFDMDGDLVTTYRHAGPGAVFHASAIGFSSDGRLYIVTSGPDLMRQEFWLLECEVGDGEVRELQRFELPFVERPAGFQHTGEGVILVVEIPFSSAPLLAVGRHGDVWHAATREPWVHRSPFRDGVKQTFGRDFDAPRVSRAELQAVLDLDRGVEELRSVAGPHVFAEFTSLIPESRPHLAGFFFDDNENVWVMRTADAAEKSRAIDVYDSTGSLLGTARAALEPDPRPRVRGSLVAGVVKDELGVEAIALYRMRR